MTPQEAVLRVRSLGDENGLTTGFWSDTNDIYKYIDSAHNEVIQELVKVFRKFREGSHYYRNTSLQALIKQATVNSVAGTGEYALASDFIEIIYAEYNPDNLGVYPADYIQSYDEVKDRSRNSFLQGDSTAEVFYCYTKGGKLGFRPIPSASVTGGIVYDYIYQPAVITSATGAFPLGTETHEAIVYYALALAFIKDEKYSTAADFLKLFYQKIGGLI